MNLKTKIRVLKKHLKSIIGFDEDKDDKIDIDKWNKHPQRLEFSGWEKNQEDKNEKHSR